jgi:hypothetical protein
MFEAFVLEYYCQVCLIEIQAETHAEYKQTLQRQQMQYEELTAARRALDEFRDRILDMRMGYLDEPGNAAKKARVLFASGQCSAILALGGDFRDALLAEVSKDEWMLKAFASAQPQEAQEAPVRQQIRSTLQWLQSEGKPGTFVIFEVKNHSDYVQMAMTDGQQMEFDFPAIICQLPNVAGGSRYERVSELPDIPGAKYEKLLDDEKLKRLLAVLPKLGLSPQMLRLASKGADGVAVGAMESVTFRVPVNATATFELLIPTLFKAVHGIENLHSLTIETGNSRSVDE